MDNSEAKKIIKIIMMYNINIISLIQLVLTFVDKDENFISYGIGHPCACQFNFTESNTRNDYHAPNTIELHKKSGFDFKNNNEMCIDAKIFRKQLFPSTFFCSENICQIVF